MKKNLFKLFVAMLAVCALAFAANCGGDDGDDGDKDVVTTPDVADEDTVVPDDDVPLPEDVVVDPCEGVECDAGFSCVDGACVEDVVVDPCDGVECDAGFSCVEGECVEDVTDPCEGVECDEGFSCVDGECVEDAPDPCADVTCDEGFKCVDGECVEDVAPTGACANEADMGVLQGDPEVGGKIQTCAMGCLGSEDPLCATDCIVEKTGLSAECSECYNGTFMCSVDNCLAQCVADPASEGCTTCQAEFCAESFTACSGIPLGGAGE